ncbi:uncharacterized protein DUF4025 [Paenibacillus methanolicus]|uniref:Uncharacterized protein DUF4025 n=1 Tax=Paenibacillus methanolicus TaxID=582686 RepID=A0A5S5BZL8_9BACL|nr:uncharacterized protein DUF4025 [Paenibacillus methanolicus]
MSKKNKNAQQLEGTELTREQFEDAYNAGTSDGIQQLADGEVKIENEGYEK